MVPSSILPNMSTTNTSPGFSRSRTRWLPLSRRPLALASASLISGFFGPATPHPTARLQQVEDPLVAIVPEAFGFSVGFHDIGNAGTSRHELGGYCTANQ